ncbi:MAG: pirin family protein [Bdellovibrionales bacterium]|nr:pirin family protein [Bdellovibrionales bacterium]
MRKSDSRGQTQTDWLKSFHSFSFGDYYDPDQRGFGHLRVINEDWIEPSHGFGKHPHRDMEIITYMIEGELAHEDSLGNQFRIRRGDIQRMSAGTGIVHSEMNPSSDEKAHLLQIWILPDHKDMVPGYEQISVPEAEKTNRLKLIASRDGAEKSVRVSQNISVYACLLEAGKSVSFQMESSHKLWVQSLTELELNGEASLASGDAASVTQETLLTIKSIQSGEFLLFHQPA